MQRVLITRVLVEQATHALANLYQVLDKIGIPSGENGRVEIVSFPVKNAGSFQFAKCQRLPGRVIVSPISHTAS